MPNNSIRRLIIVVLLAIIIGCQCPKRAVKQRFSAEVNMPTTHGITLEELYYEQVQDTFSINWYVEIPIFHYWREIITEDYLFDIPSTEQISLWKHLCEKENPVDTIWRFMVQRDKRNMNQYMTIQDLWAVWGHKIINENKDLFTLWRLEQFDTDKYVPDSEYDRFHILKKRIQRLCDFEPTYNYEMNSKAGMEAYFEELYCRMMLQEAVRHSRPRLAKALREESLAWEQYHAWVDSSYCALERTNVTSSFWSQCISGILYDDAETREISLDDFLFALTDSLDYKDRHSRSVISEYEIPPHTIMPEKWVIQEYYNFINMLEDDYDFSCSVAERKKALENEMKAWKAWIRKRKAVSSLLRGFVKDAYDNSTNDVFRAKYIMLKNRYQGYGVIGGAIQSCLIPYDADDEELYGPPFEDRWEQMCGFPW